MNNRPHNQKRQGNCWKGRKGWLWFGIGDLTQKAALGRIRKASTDILGVFFVAGQNP